MSQFGCVVALACTARGSSSHILNNSSRLKSRKAPPDAVRMTRRSPPGGTPCKHWKMAECSLSAGSMLTPYSATMGLITGPPLIRVSLLAKAISLRNLMASMVGLSPAAPTIPVTTVSAVSMVAACRIPSSPWQISGIWSKFAAFSMSFNSSAASGVANDAIFGLYFMTCSAMSLAFVPAERASTTKLSGHASTISSVCVPMLPVDPNKLKRFWKVDPLRDS
mmetsp:Transcript_34297/g.52674  ORF Transcript_34297/g.52674 Transcript_34297/m.52674 type:complete len:222 (-) Transcript_34297:249-914(-)